MKKKLIAPKDNHTIIILDKSGSMESCREATISGFNEQLQTAKNSPENLKIQLTLVTFNNNTTVEKFCESPKDAIELNMDTYKPGGSTAMYDAIGQTLKRFENEVKDDGKTNYLVIIISDGEENASQHFKQNDIAEKLQKLQATNRWTFTYMGANQDLSKVSKGLNIPIGNMMAFNNDSAGVCRGLHHTSSRMGAYYTCVSADAGVSNNNFYSNSGEITDLTSDIKVENK